MLQASIASPQPAAVAAVGTPPTKTGPHDPATALAPLPGTDGHTDGHTDGRTEVSAGVTVGDGSRGVSHALGGDGNVLPLGPGDRLHADDIIETGEGARLVLQFAHGARAIVGPESRLLITPEAEGPASGAAAAGFTPLAGRFLIDLPATPDGAEQAFVLDTTAGEIRLKAGILVLEQVRGGGVRFVLHNGADGSAGRLTFENDLGAHDVAASSVTVTVTGSTAPPLAGDAADCAWLTDPFADVLSATAAGCTAVTAVDVVTPEAPAPAATPAPHAGDAAAAAAPFHVTAAGLVVFDLTPEPAALPEAPPIAAVGAASPIALSRHVEEALYQNMSAPADESGLPQSLPPVYLTAWDPGRRWDALGAADETAGSVPEVPLEKTGLITARAGEMVQLEEAGRSTQEIEQFLKLAPGTLAGIAPDAGPTTGPTTGPMTGPTTGTAIKSLDAIRLNAGDSVRFDVFFDAAGAAPLNDFAVFSAATGDTGVALPMISIADVGDYGASGWQTIEYTAGRAGAYTFGFAILEGGSPIAPSRLYVDHVRQSETSGVALRTLDSRTDDLGGTLKRMSAQPLAVADTFGLREDEVLTLDPQSFLANDVDPDPFDPLVLHGIDRSGALGRVFPTGDGGIVYDPTLRFQSLAAGETATDGFAYIVDGGNKETSRGSVTVQIEGVNDAPVARTDTAVAQRGGPAVVLDVTANDTDVDSDDDGTTLRVVAATAQSGAKVAFDGTPGSGITYTPPASNALQADTITYMIEDRHGARAQASVAVTLTGSVPGPDVRADSGRTDEETPVTIDVLANDGAAGEALSIVSIDTAGARGTVSLGADGAITYDPRGRFEALAAGETATDRFSYIVANEAGGASTAEVMLTLTGVNDAPVATADTAAAERGGEPIVIPVLLNDTDVDSDDAAPSLRIVAAFALSGADVTFDPGPGGTVTYTPAATGGSASDRIVYTIEDSHGARAEGTLDITLAAGPAPVTARADAIAATEDQPSILAAPGLLANDQGGRSPLAITAVDDQAVGAQPLDRVLPSGARLVIAADGAVRFDPQGHYQTLAAGETAQESVRVRVGDGKTSDSALLTITIAGRNDAPITRADEAAAGEDDVHVPIAVLANDDDIDTDDTAASLRVTGAVAASGAAVTFSDAPGAGIGYTPAGRFDYLSAGATARDTITYTVTDRHGLATTGTATVTVAGRNDAPVAVDDRLNTSAGTILTLTPAIGVLANDRDADTGDRLQVVAINGDPAAVGATVVLASGAALSVNADGSLAYDPRGRFDGLDVFETATDRFAYTVADVSGATAAATATIQIVRDNQPPVAVDDTATTDARSAVRIAVLANDTDPESARLAIAAVDTTATRGQVRINTDGTVTYDPAGKFADLAAGATATDSFRYTVDDNIGGRDEATVTVTVRSSASAPPPAELFESFETPAIPVVAGWLREPGAGAVPSPTALVAAAPQAAPGLVPTHLARMLQIDAVGSSARGPGAVQSPLEAFLGLAGDAIPNDTGRHAGEAGDGTEPAGAAAVSTRITLGPGALDASGHAYIAFDWAFVTTERVTDNGGGRNDAALFTVSDGTRTRVFTLADVRADGPGSAGWRTAVYDAAVDFDLRNGGPVTLTLGFAAINDESNDNPSSLLLDNVRLNPALGTGFEPLARLENDGLSIFRPRPSVGDGAAAEVAATDEETAVSFTAATLLAGALPSAGARADTLRLAAIDGAGSTGQLTLADGRISYDPRGRFEALAEGETARDPLAFTVTDANGGSASGQAFIAIAGRNDAPAAKPDTALAELGGPPIAIAVLANDTDVDSDDDASSLRVLAASARSGALVSLTGEPGAGLLYTPPATTAGLGAGPVLTDIISYTIADRHGLTSDSVVTVSLSARNTPPIAADDAWTTDEDTVARFDARLNDQDADFGDLLTVTAINGSALGVGGSVGLASGATVVLFPDGTLGYDPRPAFQSLHDGEERTDTFTYRVSDAAGAAAEATVSVAVQGLNDAPVAALDSAGTTEDDPITLSVADLLANDTDADAGDLLRLVAIDATGTRAAVSLAGDQIIYDPQGRFDALAAGERTTDAWSYRIADEAGVTATGTVEVEVIGVNDRPIAVTDQAQTTEAVAITIDVLANDRDADAGDRLSLGAIDTAGTRGSVALAADGTLRYDPSGRFDTLQAGEQATDSFRYTVSDRSGLSDSAEVRVTIAGRNDIERVVESFETDPLPDKTGFFVNAAGVYQETDGDRGLYVPTDPVGGGGRMAVLEARGHPASALEQFLGLPAGTLPRDSDGSFPAAGSALKLTADVQAGDEVSFDWMFDARDAVFAPTAGQADNDYAFATINDGTTTRLFSLADVRAVGDHGASDWRSSIFTASAAGPLVIGFGVVNDRITEFSGPEAENSFLLVDNVRVNRAFDEGYQVVSSQGQGAFETLAHQPSTT
ncbi:MAG: Ig-like domain-containing protein [Defluviicoccus sp.]